MENKEYEQAPKKGSKSLHLVIGIVIGAVIATVIILVVLFATGVIGGEKEATTTVKTPETTAAAEKETTAKPSEENTPSASDGKYKEFELKNISVYYENDNNDETKNYSKTENRTIQIPCMTEFNELGLDLDSLEINTAESHLNTNGTVTLAYIYAWHGSENIPLIAICYRGTELSYANILMVYFDLWFADPETGLEKGCDGRYLGVDELIWKSIRFDGENDIGYGLTNSGYSFKNGVYYDDHGNVITYEDYSTELNRIDNEVFAALSSEGYVF